MWHSLASEIKAEIYRKVASGKTVIFLPNEGDVTGAAKKVFLHLSAFNVDIIPRAGAGILRPWGKKREEKA